MRRRSSSNHRLLVVALMVVCVVVGVGSGECGGRKNNNTAVVANSKTHVEVYNKFHTGAAYNIHCKSKDDDLGFHDIWPGQFYHFSFQVNLWGRTLFFCTIKSNDYGYAEFDVYYAQRDLKRCEKRCLWDVTAESINGFKQLGHVHDLTVNWTK